MSTEQKSVSAEVIEAMKWQIDHTQKQIVSLKKAKKRVGDAEILQVKGTLLKTYANQIDLNKGYAVLPDYSHPGKDLTVYLDNKKTIMENAEEYFHQYHRDKRGLDTIKQHLVQAQSDLVKQLKRQANFNPDDESQAKVVKQQLIDEDAIKTEILHSSKAPEPAHPRRFYTTDNVLVEVGKNSVQNDHLTLTAKKDYYWMHVSELAGSHVVIHSTDPSEQTLLEAASLALITVKDAA
jgi:Predicted RNA-binding protein homologous to eukaryotic snRNP